MQRIQKNPPYTSSDYSPLEFGRIGLLPEPAYLHWYHGKKLKTLNIMCKNIEYPFIQLNQSL